MIGAIKITQINLNHSWAALDLLRQHMAENNVTLAIVSEPPKGIKAGNECFVSEDGSAAVVWKSDSSEWACRLVDIGIGFVVVSVEDVQVVSCYFSPNVSRNDFTKALDILNRRVKALAKPYIICGDFNAHASMWGSRDTNRRGELVSDWSAELDLRLMNVGDAYTCVRPQGSSIIDLSWASPGITRRIDKWMVLVDKETLFDHLYIEFVLKNLKSKWGNLKDPSLRRWNFKKLDEELFCETLEFLNGAEVSATMETDTEEYATWMHEIMVSACNTAAPVVTRANRRKQVYWWSEVVSELRVEVNKARRRWSRSKCKGDATATQFVRKKEYAKAKKALRNEIKKAKNSAWSELIQSLDRDPWGLPYKIVMSKLRKSSPALSEMLDEANLNRLLDSLFPVDLGESDWGDPPRQCPWN